MVVVNCYFADVVVVFPRTVASVVTYSTHDCSGWLSYGYCFMHGFV